MISIDSLPVENEQEAEKLLFYHLQLAAQLFEATGWGIEGRIPDVHSASAITAWLAAIEALYPEEDE